MSDLKALLENLKKEVPYQWRVQSKTADKTKAICSAYIDARDVMNILDEYCTHGWQSAIKTENGFVFAGIGIKVDGEWMWRWDAGSRIEEKEGDSMYDQAAKSSASDALKRAAVQWGVGRFTYDIPLEYAPLNQYGKVINEAGEVVYDLTKFINDRKSGKKNRPATPPPAAKQTEAPKKSETPAAPQAPESKGELPVLSGDAFKKMEKAINDGDWKKVEESLPKYKVSDSQMAVLKALITKAKKQ